MVSNLHLGSIKFYVSKKVEAAMCFPWAWTLALFLEFNLVLFDSHSLNYPAFPHISFSSNLLDRDLIDVLISAKPM